MRYKTDQRINGTALESIMQEVQHGMQEFTTEACSGGDITALEIIAVEKSAHRNTTADHIIPFPHTTKT